MERIGLETKPSSGSSRAVVRASTTGSAAGSSAAAGSSRLLTGHSSPVVAKPKAVDKNGFTKLSASDISVVNGKPVLPPHLSGNKPSTIVVSPSDYHCANCVKLKTKLGKDGENAISERARKGSNLYALELDTQKDSAVMKSLGLESDSSMPVTVFAKPDGEFRTARGTDDVGHVTGAKAETVQSLTETFEERASEETTTD